VRIAAGILVVLALIVIVYFVAFRHEDFQMPENFPVLGDEEKGTDESELATFGSGCFWCSEAVFLQMKGVTKVVSGYSGGTTPNPTYEQVSREETGHAEVVQVTFDPKVISYAELLEVFWRSHDPTTLNRQGHDSGTQYRSVIFTHSDRQQKLAETYRRKIDEAHVFPNPLVTQIAPITTFYPAEKYHQNYFALNGRNGYCQTVIRPKIDHLKKVFEKKLKPE
jgi:peptide-methionine (S)-S-oxide reductase